MSTLRAKRHREKFACDSSRVITKFFAPGGEVRVRGLVARILAIPETRVEHTLQKVLEDFATRHRDINDILHANYERVTRYISDSDDLSESRKLLVGAYFTSEYSIESAALFNPSIVAHPDQSGVDPGCLRFILSFRATGEGHISSLVFRNGILDGANRISMALVSPYVETPRVEPNPSYDRHTFLLKLDEIEARNTFVQDVFASLEEHFSLEQLEAGITRVERENDPSLILRETIEIIDWVAQSNYSERFQPQSKLSERVIFPVARHESNGIEDARFVRFTDINEESCYYATYTATDGHTILPMLLRTEDFLSFTMCTLNGPAVKDKGLALFPRRVNGQYMMISRQDGENMYIMASDNLHFWHEAKPLQRPEFDWELVQVGNCGSPIETEAGWLLLTHGVGPVRRYCIGAMLLDLDDPSKVVGRLEEPLIEPREHEREGYVPNVVYACGALIHANALVIPFAMSDTASGIATVPLQPLLDALVGKAGNPTEEPVRHARSRRSPGDPASERHAPVKDVAAAARKPRRKRK